VQLKQNCLTELWKQPPKAASCLLF